MSVSTGARQGGHIQRPVLGVIASQFPRTYETFVLRELSALAVRYHFRRHRLGITQPGPYGNVALGRKVF